MKNVAERNSLHCRGWKISMICPQCQDSGVIILYQNGMPIRRPCPCLTRGQSLDRIQLMRRSGQPPAQPHTTFADVTSSGHRDAISLLVVAAILPRFDHLGTCHIAAPTSGLNLF